MAYPQKTYQNTTFLPGFIDRRRQVVYSNTIPYQLNVLKETGRYDAFKLKWHPSYNDKPDVWPVPNHLFWDSDVAKWIEGACYFLQCRDNMEIHAAVKELVDMIGSAQQPDGYLNIHFTVVEPTKRFTNLRDLHELYNAGHLIEAALAHNDLYSNDQLLAPILKYVNLLCDTFGPLSGQKHGYPGHPEIELALLRLFEKTRDQKHFNLAKYFLEERGKGGGSYYDLEAESRGDRENERPAYWPSNRCYWYQQAHKPIVEQETIEGHSVRAMYLLTALADLDRIENSSESLNKKALERLWTNMVNKKMYLTGGIGSQKQWEGFGIDYFLPLGTEDGGCYAETCAAIGVMMLAERLLQIDLDGKYGDIMELCFYNAVLTGMSEDGKRFTYVNQLASSDTDLSKRAEWFTCACCPPNVTRLLGYIGGYLWSFEYEARKRAVDINVHLYSSATLEIPVADSTMQLRQKSNWPWDGQVDFALVSPDDSISTTIRLRVPAWASEWHISPELLNPICKKGYITLTKDWLKNNPTFRLTISMMPRFVSPHPYSNQDVVALMRGPLVYCVEDVDNAWVDDHFKSLLFDTSATVTEATKTGDGILEPYVALTAYDATSFLRPNSNAGPHSSAKLETVRNGGAEELHFVPYCLRDNRGGKGHMRVGLRQRR